MEVVAHGDSVYFLGGETNQGVALDKVYQINANVPENNPTLIQHPMVQGTAN